VWPNSFCSLVEGRLLGQGVSVGDVNISSDILGFFMTSFRIREVSLSPFLANIMIDLSLTSEITFLLLQKR
jgi:hypothetical protein